MSEDNQVVNKGSNSDHYMECAICDRTDFFKDIWATSGYFTVTCGHCGTIQNFCLEDIGENNQIFPCSLDDDSEGDFDE